MSLPYEGGAREAQGGRNEGGTAAQNGAALVPRVPPVMMMAASVESPRASDGRTCGIAHNGTGYCAHGPEHDGTRQGTQRRISGAFLSARPKRCKRHCNHRGSDQLFHLVSAPLNATRSGANDLIPATLRWRRGKVRGGTRIRRRAFPAVLVS